MGDNSDSDYSFTASDTSFNRRPTLRIQSGSKATLNFDCNYLGKGFIDLRNPSTEKVAFKVRTTAPASYMVRPSVGVMGPKTQRRIRLEYVHAEPLHELAKRDPHEYLPRISKDKFMIQSMVVDSLEIPSADMWADGSHKLLSQVLTVEFFYRSDIIHQRRHSGTSRYTATSSFDGVPSSHFQSLIVQDGTRRMPSERQETLSTEASIPRPRIRKSVSTIVPYGGGAVAELEHPDGTIHLPRPPMSGEQRQRALSHRPSPIAEIPSRVLMSEEESVQAAKESLQNPADGRLGTFELSSASVCESDVEVSIPSSVDSTSNGEQQTLPFRTPAFKDSSVPLRQALEAGDDVFGVQKLINGTGGFVAEGSTQKESLPLELVSTRKVLRRLTEPYPMSHRVVKPEREANLAKVLELGNNCAQTRTADMTPRNYRALMNEYHLLKDTLAKREEQIKNLQKILETRMNMSSGRYGGMSVRADIADKAIQSSWTDGALQECTTSRSSIIAGLILIIVFVGMAFLGLRSGASQLEQLL